MGVYAEELVEVIARVQAELGSEHALVVHGSDGLDEITITGPTSVGEVRGGEVRTYTIEPEALGLPRGRLEDLVGGDPQHNAAAMERLLAGEQGPLRDVVALNAGAALYVAGLADGLREGLEQAAAALASGAARAKLDALRSFAP
jgi:anthranilate phosphoribosyltransferase